MVLATIVGLLALIGSTQAQLQLGFYAKSCPNAEKIVLDFVHQHIHNALHWQQLSLECTSMIALSG